MSESRNYYFAFSNRSEDWVDNIKELDSRNDLDAFSAYKLIPEAIKDIKHIICSVILNGKWQKPQFDFFTKNNLLKQLNYYDYPKTPEEKINLLFDYLFSLQVVEGEHIPISEEITNSWKKLYFRSYKEFLFYLDTLDNSRLIKKSTYLNQGEFNGYSLTYNGLEYAMNLRNEGKTSSNCFVAMSFDEEDLSTIYEKGFFPVLKEFGLNPLIVKHADYESEKTINDAMIALIKKSKFMIADFTKQKRNVYFEAGYAAGLGLKVIYTCKVEHFHTKEDINKTSAFDTNHFPHIIWKDIEDLKKQLRNKIEAVIL